MHIKIKYLFLLLVLAGTAVAQKNIAVYYVTGSANIITANKVTPAKRGDVIAKNYLLQLDKNAGCMLIDEKGRSLQVSTAGTYSLATLHKMMTDAGKKGVSQKFFSYVYDNLFSAKKADQLSITPVVFRGEKLMRSPADYTLIISDLLVLGWKRSAGNTSYHLVVKGAQPIGLLDTLIKKSTSLQLNLAEHFLPGNMYLWKVEEAGIREPKENYYHFLIAQKADRKKILKDLKMLQDKGLGNELKMQMQQDIFRKWAQEYAAQN